jgi:AcrR family transcriptional regulator
MHPSLTIGKTERSFCYRGPMATTRTPARERLLSVASGLFYREGIRAVGVERILAEVPTTRATFYRHFPSRDDLVVAYLRGVDTRIRADLRAAVDGAASPSAALRAIGDAVADSLATPGFRGCAFLNAGAEFPDPDHPIHRAVLDHRAWYAATITGLFAQIFDTDAERPDPRHAAQHFIIMRDGAMAGAQLDGAADVGDVLRRGVDGLLNVVHPTDLDGRPIDPRRSR